MCLSGAFKIKSLSNGNFTKNVTPSFALFVLYERMIFLIFQVELRSFQYLSISFQYQELGEFK